MDVVTPETVTGIRHQVSLQSVGYDFGWNRFVPRSEGVRDLSPEDSADLEVFLARVSSGVLCFSILANMQFRVPMSSQPLVRIVRNCEARKATLRRGFWVSSARSELREPHCRLI